MSLVATGTVKYRGVYYAPGTVVPVKREDMKSMKERGLVIERVTPEDAAKAREFEAKVANLKAEIAEAEEALAAAEAEIAAAKPVASELSERKAAAKKDDSEANRAALAEAEAAKATVDKFGKQREALVDVLATKKAALKALE